MMELKEARSWLYSAKALFDSKEAEPERYTVVVAQCIHSIIRANDALTIRFLRKKAFRHEEAPELFSQLLEQGKIPSKWKKLKQELLIPAVRTKSLADYRGLKVKRIRAAEWINDARKFIKVVEECLS